MTTQLSLADLFEAAPGYIAVTAGPEHRIQVANAAYRALMRRDVLGRTVADAFPEFEAQGHIALLDRVYQTGEPFRTDGQPIEIVLPDGTTERRHVSFVYQPILTDGQVTGIFAEGLDVSPVIEAREAMRRAEIRLNAFFDQSAVGISEADLTGRFLRVNHRYAEIVGRTEAELLSLRMQDITHPEDLPGNLPLFGQAATDGGSFEIEKRYLKPDGSTVWVLNSVTGLRAESGDISSIICVSIDITDRRAAQQRLDESKERFRRIFDQTSDLIVTADLQQVITGCNPAAAAAVGMSADQVIGHPISDFISAEDFQKTSGMLAHKLQNGGDTVYDVRVKNAAGDWMLWEINSGLATDREGQPIGLHILARDVTERKQMEERQRLLLAELNHRVKNTLAIVQSIARQTLLKSTSPGDALELLEGRLASLAGAQNAITKASWGPVRLDEIVKGALAPFCTTDRCRLRGDPVKVTPRIASSLSLAMHELATNASKYGALSNDDGCVTVDWTSADGELRIRWSETGGPAVTEPGSRGFGSLMIERALARELRGTARLSFEPEGLVCDIRAPQQPD